MLGQMQLALGGSRKRGGWTGELITDASFLVARNAYLDVEEKATLDIQLNVSRTTLPTGAAIYIDFYSLSTFHGVNSDPRVSCSFWIDWNDPGSTYVNQDSDRNRNDASKSSGYQGSHLYETAGTYTIKVYVWHPATNNKGYAEIEVTVIDAATYYAGKIVAWSPSGDFTGAPAGATQVTTYSAMVSAFNGFGSGTPRMIALGGGEIIAGFNDFVVSDDVQIRAFGTGKARVKSKEGGAGGFALGPFRCTGDFFSIYNIEIFGDYDPVAGTGENYRDRGVYISGSLGGSVARCDIYGVGISLSFSAVFQPLNKKIAIVDNSMHDWYDLSNFGDTTFTAFSGNSTKQNPNTVSGLGFKGNYENEFPANDGDTNFVIDNVILFGFGTDYLAVFLQDSTTLVSTELFAGVDYTLTVGTDAGINSSGSGGDGTGTHEIDLTNPKPAGTILRAYTRRWADHSAYRFSTCESVSFYREVMASYNDWSSNGESQQPNIRWSTDGLASSYGFASECLFINGNNMITATTRNDSVPAQVAGPFVVEQCIFQAGDRTEVCIGLWQTNIYIRNNYALIPDVPTAWAGHEFVAFVRCGKNDSTGTEIDVHGVHIYNNTIIVLTSTANNVKDVVVKLDNAKPFANVYESNNLLYVPDRPTPLPVQYTPLEALNYYKPKFSNPAIDAGTPTALVWDDFDGLLVGNDAFVGAHGTRQRYVLNMLRASNSNISIAGSISGLTASADSFVYFEFYSNDTEFNPTYFTSSGSSFGAIDLSNTNCRVRLGSGAIKNIAVPINYRDGQWHPFRLILNVGEPFRIEIDGNEYLENTNYVTQTGDVVGVSTFGTIGDGGRINGGVRNFIAKDTDGIDTFTFDKGFSTEDSETSGAVATFNNCDSALI